jgi:hypothetical protein
MPATQIITFTAIPRGVSLNAKTLPVSVFISPRLSGEDKLGAYPDWVSWTRRRHKLGLRITFECNGQKLTVEAPRKQLRPKLWEALFNEETFVRFHQFDDYSDRFIASYQVRWALSALKATYQATSIAFAMPSTEDDLRDCEDPRRECGYKRRELFRSLIEGYDANWDEATGSRWRAEQIRLQQSVGRFSTDRVRYQSGQLGDDGLFRAGVVEPGAVESKKLHQNVVHPFSVFNHMPQGVPLKRESLDEKTVIDFHQALSSLNTYPELQRKLGLVFDLELPIEFIVASQGQAPGELRIVQVDGGWDINTSTTISPTSTAYINLMVENGDRLFCTAPRNLLNPEIFGLLNLDPTRFGLVQVDVDGGLHKIIILAETMMKSDNPGPARPQHPEVFDHTTTLASLRSGGISLFADARAMSLLDTFLQSKEFNQTLEKGQPQPRPFCAEDLVRGYRLDVWDEVTGKWHSLHQRHATYLIGDSEVKTQKEEGFVQLAATQAAPNEDGTRESNDLHLHEAIARWNGWSLSADTPGKHLTRAADPDQAVPDPVNPDLENEPITPFKMTTSYHVMKGSLPRLRIGGRYRLRARVVDLAGNSLKLNEPITDLLTPVLSLPRGDKTFPYMRFEPSLHPS